MSKTIALEELSQEHLYAVWNTYLCFVDKDQIAKVRRSSPEETMGRIASVLRASGVTDPIRDSDRRMWSPSFGEWVNAVYDTEAEGERARLVNPEGIVIDVAVQSLVRA